MRAYQESYSSASGGFCAGFPLGTGNGNIAFQSVPSGHPHWNVITPAGEKAGEFGAWRGSAWATPSGFIQYGGSSTEQMVNVDGLSSDGNRIGSTDVNGSAWFTPDPKGGLLAVGHFSAGSAPREPPADQMIEMFNADGTTRWGPAALGSNAAVFGAGVDLLGRAVVILDGGSGNIDAIWFNSDGKPATGVFRLISGFSAGPSTWFETSPLIGGGLVLRRMDAPSDRDERRTSQWLLILPSGSASTGAAPDWLTSRPNTEMQLARSGRAYALLPWSTDASVCDQQVEVMSPSGRSCGKADFSVDGSSCRTRDLRLGYDGTVLQMMPVDREQNSPAGSPIYTCTLRYWPAALK